MESKINKPYVVSTQMIDEIFRDHKKILLLQNVLLNIWEESTLDYIINAAFYDKQGKIDLIQSEGLFEPDLDELRSYFDFTDAYYPDHFQAFVDAGIIPPEAELELE